MRHTCGTKYLVSSKHISNTNIYETMVFPMMRKYKKKYYKKNKIQTLNSWFD